MSNEKGPEAWRFQNCEMRGFHTCDKKDFPPDYDPDKCKKYFDKSSFNMDKESTQTLKNVLGLSSELADVDVMRIEAEENDGKWVTERTCYQPANLRRFGWCYLQRPMNLHTIPPGETPWGICSPSCSTTSRKARIKTIYNILPDMYIKSSNTTY